MDPHAPASVSSNDRLCPLARFMSRLGYLLGSATRVAANVLDHVNPKKPSPPRPLALQGARRPPRGHLHRPPRSSTEDPTAALRRELPGIGRALQSPDPLVRLRLLNNLHELDQEQAQVVLLELLNDPDSQLREAAAAATARLQLTSLVFALLLALNDPASSVQEQARRSLEQLTGQAIPLDSSFSHEQRQQQIDKLKEWWKKQRLSQLKASTELPR